MTPNYAFPVLSPNGQDVISGSGTVTLNDTPLWPGYSPGFLNAGRTLIWTTAPGLATYDRDTQVTTVVNTNPASVVAAGGTRWATVLNGRELHLSGQPVQQGRYFLPSVDDSGACAWLVDGGKGQQSIYVRRQGVAAQKIVTGPFGEPRLRHNCLLWKRNLFLDGHWTGQTWGMRLGTDPTPVLVSPTTNQGSAVPVKVPGRILIVAADGQHRLLLYPFKAKPTKGYIVATGTTFMPDARLINPTTVRVVFWKSPGLGSVVVDLNQPMVTL